MDIISNQAEDKMVIHVKRQEENFEKREHYEFHHGIKASLKRKSRKELIV